MAFQAYHENIWFWAGFFVYLYYQSIFVYISWIWTKNLFKKSCLHNPLFAFHNYLNIVVSYAKFSASSHDTVHKKSYAFYHVEHYEKHL